MAFAPSKRKKWKTIEPAGVNLNAMMDMMVIILLFLLQTYAVTGALIRPSIDNLPLSTSDTQPRKTLSVVLTRDGLFEENEAVAGKDARPDRARQLVDPAELADTTSVSLPSFELYLKHRRDLERSLGKAVTSHEVTVQAAQDVPYAWILKLINAASLADYDVFEFLVVREDHGEGR